MPPRCAQTPPSLETHAHKAFQQFLNNFVCPRHFLCHNHIMLNQTQIPAYIAGELPQISRDLNGNGAALTAWQSIQVLTDYTKRMALEHDFKMVGQCMRLIDKLYRHGNALVRAAIENVFVFSFSSMLYNCNIVEWRIVQSYMPAELYAVFIEQLLKSKC